MNVERTSFNWPNCLAISSPLIVSEPYVNTRALIIMIHRIFFFYLIFIFYFLEEVFANTGDHIIKIFIFAL